RSANRACPPPPGLCGPRVETIDVRWQLGRCDVSLIIGANAERWIGEPDRVIGFDGHVIRRIESFALEPVHQDGDRPIVFGACDSARLVLAADAAALAVARVADGVDCPRRVDPDRTVALHPSPPGRL